MHGLAVNLIMSVSGHPSIINEIKKSGNWSYQKISTVKFVHLNLHFFNEIQS